MKRRETLRLIPLSIAGITGLSRNALTQHKSMPGHDKGPHHGIQPPMHGKHPEPLSVRYTKQVRDRLIWVRETQSENLLEASYLLAKTYMNGRTNWCSWDMGHNTKNDMFPRRNGVPEIITMGYDPKKSKKGDSFLANTFGGSREDLVKRSGPHRHRGRIHAREPRHHDSTDPTTSHRFHAGLEFD